MTTAPSFGGDAPGPAAWRDLPLLPVVPVRARRRAVVGGWGGAAREPYDVLRTRSGQALGDGGWTRLGVTQARRSVAGAATALNLALSAARREDRRVALVELDLAGEAVLGLLGRRLAPGPGRGPFEGRLRLTDNLALVCFAAPPGSATEALAAASFRHRLDEILSGLQPDLVLLHAPPILEGDAGLAAIELCEAVLLVVDGAADTAGVLREAEALIAARRPLLGLFHHAAEA